MKADPTVESLYEAIQKEKDKAIVAESDFVRDILPRLISIDKDKGDLTIWLDYAGTWQRGIAVVDDNNKENILFELPGLVGTIDVPHKQKPNDSIYDVIRNSARKMAVVPRAGYEMLKQEVGKRISIKNERTKNEYLWASMFKRYGYDVDLPEVEVETTTTINQVEGYDEA